MLRGPGAHTHHSSDVHFDGIVINSFLLVQPTTGTMLDEKCFQVRHRSQPGGHIHRNSRAAAIRKAANAPVATPFMLAMALDVEEEVLEEPEADPDVVVVAMPEEVELEPDC